jgi:hypothetical protein
MIEAIAKWKNAHGDIAKHRAEQGKEVTLVSLKKDGTEGKMPDATKSFKTEAEAREYHDRVVKLNPGKLVRHNIYCDGKKEQLG